MSQHETPLVKPQSVDEMLVDLKEFEDVLLESESVFPHATESVFIDKNCETRGRSRSIMDSLLFEIYDKLNFGRRFSEDSDANYTECSTMSESVMGTTYKPVLQYSKRWETNSEHLSIVDSCKITNGNLSRYKKSSLQNKGIMELEEIVTQYKKSVNQVAGELVRQLKRRDKWLNKRDRNYDVITAILQASSLKRSIDTRMRFSVEPFSGESGFSQWHDAMRMVVKLPGGIPTEFRKRLWLTMTNRHIVQRHVEWEKIKRFCFNDRSNPDDNELGVQIVKDLHRTGCSLFCGVEAEHNQALLKRVLLAYARWNKTVGYCQGFNMLVALILEVVEWKEDDALKVLIYLLEGVLPESYFANNLHGLSVDMAVFRDLLRMRLPQLSQHLDQLQLESRDKTSGTIYEPPLTNVFTIQWFLTIFSNCLPKESVLRVWDLMFLEGNEVLLRTALTIWDELASHIMKVQSADEYYSVMGVLTRDTLEFGIIDADHLVKMMSAVAPFPFPQLAELRDKYTYNITPFSSASMSTMAKTNFRILYSDDEEDEEEQLAVAAWCLSTVFPPHLKSIANKAEEVVSRNLAVPFSGENFSSIGPGAFSSNNHQVTEASSKTAINKERSSLDIASLKKQYAKLRERQKQAHVILKAASVKKQTSNVSVNGVIRPQSLVVNHLLVGRKALSSRRRRPMGSSSSQPSPITSPSQPITFRFKPSDAQPTKKRRNRSKPSDEKHSEYLVVSGKHRRFSLPAMNNLRLKIPPQNFTFNEDENREDYSCSSSSNKTLEESGKSSVVDENYHVDIQLIDFSEANDKVASIQEKEDNSSAYDRSSSSGRNSHASISNNEDYYSNSEKRKEWLTKRAMYRKSDDHPSQSSSDEFFSLPSDQSELDDEEAQYPENDQSRKTQLRKSSTEKSRKYGDIFIPNQRNDELDYSTAYKDFPSNLKSGNVSPIKAKIESFNPFPVARKSSIREAGVKLGIYESTNKIKNSRKISFPTIQF